MEEKWATLVYQGTHYDNYEIDENGYVRNKTTKHILKRRIENGNEKRNGKPYFPPLYSTAICFNFLLLSATA